MEEARLSWLLDESGTQTGEWNRPGYECSSRTTSSLERWCWCGRRTAFILAFCQIYHPVTPASGSFVRRRITYHFKNIIWIILRRVGDFQCHFLMRSCRSVSSCMNMNDRNAPLAKTQFFECSTVRFELSAHVKDSLICRRRLPESFGLWNSCLQVF